MLTTSDDSAETMEVVATRLLPARVESIVGENDDVSGVEADDGNSPDDLLVITVVVRGITVVTSVRDGVGVVKLVTLLIVERSTDAGIGELVGDGTERTRVGDKTLLNSLDVTTDDDDTTGGDVTSDDVRNVVVAGTRVGEGVKVCILIDEVNRVDATERDGLTMADVSDVGGKTMRELVSSTAGVNDVVRWILVTTV